MALARWQRTIVNEVGDVQPLASIEVRLEVSGQPFVALFSDRDGTVALGNPFLADAEGFAAFHVEGGAYKVTASLGGFSRTWRYEGIGTSSEFDVSFDGSVLEVSSFWPQEVVTLIADRDQFDVGPVFDERGRRLSVLVTADETNPDNDSPPNPQPTVYFLLSIAPAVWSDGFTFNVMIPEVSDGDFTGDGVETEFDLEFEIQDGRYIAWYEDGIRQRYGVDFTTSGSVVTRTSPPAVDAEIWWVMAVVSDVTGLGTAIAGKVDRAGDTMTGPLVLDDDASAPLGAATKQQLDAAIATEVTNRNAAITAAVVGLFDDRGNYNASVNTFPASGGSGTAGAILKGDLWTASVAGTLGGAPVSVGDTIRAIADTPGQTAGNWALGEANIGDVPAAIAAAIHAATEKTTPVDADELALSDSAASFALKRLTWANVKATLKTYFDTLYAALAGAVFTGPIQTTTVELGHASDTTLERSAAGAVTIEGKEILSAKDAQFTAYTEKTTPVAADLLVIEDSAASGAKKKLQLTNLPAGSITGGNFVRGLTGQRHASTTTRVDMAADFAVFRNPSTGVVVAINNLASVAIDTTTAGPAAGGRDIAGAFTSGATIHFYFIRKDDGTIAGISSEVGPTTGPTLPTGYTTWAYATSIKLNASTTVLFYVWLRGQWVWFTGQQVLLSLGVATVETSLNATLALVLPANALAMQIGWDFNNATGAIGGYTLGLRVLTGLDFRTEKVSVYANSGTVTHSGDLVMPNVSQTIYYIASSALMRHSVYFSGYSIPNGGG